MNLNAKHSSNNNVNFVAFGNCNIKHNGWFYTHSVCNSSGRAIDPFNSGTTCPVVKDRSVPDHSQH